MAIAAAMSRDEAEKDAHENDLVMPGFRFHPTEEELIEFYLRRKVEGKRFNVDLITFLDLYRYDPWELPSLAAIGEKEWFFYVPRDRKYRNGDRPNRVTTSGYWKATGADRMIRSENSRPIGLKKTLVFYSGKAPKGIRTSWIMNEYRLPQPETDRNYKIKSRNASFNKRALQTEISLCRVYKRPGVEDHHRSSNKISSKASSSSTTTPDKNLRQINPLPIGYLQSAAGEGPSPSSELGDCKCTEEAMYASSTTIPIVSLSSTPMEEEGSSQYHSQPPIHSSSDTSVHELSRIVSYLNQPQLLPVNQLPPLLSNKLWEWNDPFSDAARDYSAVNELHSFIYQLLDVCKGLLILAMYLLLLIAGGLMYSSTNYLMLNVNLYLQKACHSCSTSIVDDFN
ncbi:Putative NAC domain-containing protein 94 [Dendrobium catenatum]|uniref:NAC domain-containing protein 94 n=1 Tax=Dendrobium catenatum TaxID=906689 RepID=A0A2I0WXD5_9ASPA|nr:Putative NAC domain-containing protein 94 [Dendrobium catenatum]